MRILILASTVVLGASTLAPAAVDFSHEVLPLLKEKCVKCHTNGKYKGGLSMDTREALLDSEGALAGNSQESEIMLRVLHSDPDERMPPESEPLAEAEVLVLKRWIDEGLPWEEGLTFKKSGWKSPVKPRRVKLPGADGDINPIDRIVRAYLEEKEIEAPAALDDRTYLRRVSLDLVGLLPEPAAVEAFLADNAPDKRARVARELLGRRRDYAEHWLSFWNDLLRNDYAGTGFIDGGRKQVSGWLYQALWDNKGYDAFVRELIDATPETEGFIRGIKWRGNVNASQVQEVQFAQNISQVFLGENMKCASCHDSFINDWKLADAYALAAIIAPSPLELHRCDKPTGEIAKAAFLFPELGTIDPTAPPKERLKQTAALMTSPENGRLARTVVNRIWQRLLGRGLVEPVDIMGNRPWSEDLLDYLGARLVDDGYDLKKLMELIVTSRTYQSQSVDPYMGPVEEYVFKGPVMKRMTAEQFVDAVWKIAGAGPDKIAAPVTRAEGVGPVRASLVNASLLMRALGRPNREQVVTTRPAELSTLQALELNNGKEFVALLEKGAAKLLAEHANSPVDVLAESLYREALGRAPEGVEWEVARDIIGEPVALPGVSDLLWAVLMLPEFQLIR